jgi:hypothetical protein
MAGCASLSRLVNNRTLPVGLAEARKCSEKTLRFLDCESAQLGLFPNALPRKTPPVEWDAPWKFRPTGDTLGLGDCGRVDTLVLGIADDRD